MAEPHDQGHDISAPSGQRGEETRTPSYDELQRELTWYRQHYHELTKRFEIGLRGSNICVYLQDLDLKYVWMHNAPEGLQVSEIIGRTDADLLSPGECKRVTDMKTQALRDSKVHKGEAILMDGSRQRVFEIQVEPYVDIHGAVIGVLGVAVEITAQRTRESELRQALREMSHRSKNQLTTLLSILRQTSRRSANVEDFALTFEERLRGLVHTQDLLVANDWKGIGLTELLKAQAHTLRVRIPDQLVVNGPNVRIKTEPAQNISLALHELLRNATHHGALSQSKGRVRVNWAFVDQGGTSTVMLHWLETEGPTLQTTEQTSGFGLMILKRVLGPTIGGPVDLEFRPTGLCATITISSECLAH